ncbi:MAG TPA: RidA family protein [Flavisolibacter sp.]|jgi:enamine deaminase RidA (YjgF/YER057c/UK114 family)|nr:RidA family protein [Flavisolibacter sp.]
MSSTIEGNLKQAGIHLLQPPKPGGSYVSVNIRAGIAYVAIQFPIKEGQFFYQGRLGENMRTEEGISAAQLCAINILSQVEEHVGFDRILGLNHLDIYYQQVQGWDDGPAVADGASELFLNILSEKGRHTRTIVGVHFLPRNFSVGIAASFTIH